MTRSRALLAASTLLRWSRIRSNWRHSIKRNKNKTTNNKQDLKTPQVKSGSPISQETSKKSCAITASQGRSTQMARILMWQRCIGKLETRQFLLLTSITCITLLILTSNKMVLRESWQIRLKFLIWNKSSILKFKLMNNPNLLKIIAELNPSLTSSKCQEVGNPIINPLTYKVL